MSADWLVPHWWEEWPGRLEEEVEAFARRGLLFEVDPDRLAAGEVALRGKLEIEPGRVEEIVVVYPDTFPFTRFSVYAPDLVLERHQHPFGRNLCVFPRGSEHWRPSIMAADVVAERVPEIVRVVGEGGETLRRVEVAQGEPFSDYYTYWPLGGILVPSSALRLPTEAQDGTFDVRMAGSDEWLRSVGARSQPERPYPIGQGILSRIGGSDGQIAGDDGLGGGFAGPVWKGRWVRVDQPIAADGEGFLAELLHAHPRLAAPSYPNGGFRLLGVVFPEEVRQGVWEDAWVFAVEQRARGRRASGLGPVALVRGTRASVEDLGERIPELACLRQRAVALAGLGALGKPVALEFARSLVADLRLLDFDAVEAGNAVRWPDGFRAAGVDKVIFTDTDFALQYPHTRVTPVQVPVGMAPLHERDNGEAEALATWLEGADLVVELTAETNVTSALCYLARRQATPAVVAWSVEGAGGVVARIVPGETGCYHCLDEHLRRAGGTIPTPVPPAREWVQPPGCAQPTFPTPNVDLVGVSEMVTRMALGELCRGVEGGYPRLRHDVYVLFLREPDGSLVDPPRWEGDALPVHPDCAQCNHVG